VILPFDPKIISAVGYPKVKFVPSLSTCFSGTQTECNSQACVAPAVITINNRAQVVTYVVAAVGCNSASKRHLVTAPKARWRPRSLVIPNGSCITFKYAPQCNAARSDVTVVDTDMIGGYWQAADISSFSTVWLKPGFHYPSWRPELTGDRFPLPVNNQHAPCWRARVSTSRVNGPSTRLVETRARNENRSHVNSGSGNRS